MDLEYNGFEFDADSPMPRENMVLKFKINIKDSTEKLLFTCD